MRTPRHRSRPATWIRAVALLVLVCLVHAAVPPPGSWTPGSRTGASTSSSVFGGLAGDEHRCGCGTACGVSCCCADGPADGAPATPVYSPCGGGGPRVVPASSHVVAVLPSAIATPAERPSLPHTAPAAPPSSSPSLEPSTPPPRRLPAAV